MSRWVIRFGATERLYHWAQALPYLALMVSGGLMLFGSLLGTDEEARTRLRLIHLISALAMLILPFLVVLGGRTSALFANAREALTWGADDFRWMFCSVKRIVRRSTPLPEAGKFNPGQKINFIAVMITLPLFALSGAVMFFAKGALIAWYLHVGLFCLSIPLTAGHVFMAIVNPSTRHSMHAIVAGTVKEEWARHHHGAWARGAERVDGAAPLSGSERSEPCRDAS